MSLNSVNTNVGARVALSHLGATRSELATTQRRLATGLRVASVKDNGSVWSIAQAQRGDVRALGSITGSIQRARSVIDVAMAAGEVVSDLLLKMREKALAASDSGLDAAAQSALNTDFVQLRDQITRIVNEADFDGLNLIDAAAKDHEIPAGLVETWRTKTKKVRLNPPGGPPVWGFTTTTTLSRPTLDLYAERLNLNGDNVTLRPTDDIASAATRPAVLTALTESIRNVSAALARLGTMNRAFGTHQNLLFKMRDALETSVGNLVDADLGKEGAKLQALQAKEKLGIQALGIANRAPQTLLGLFRD